MKTTPFKMLLTGAALFLGTAASAQFYPPNPSNPEYPYPPPPPPPPVATTTSSSCNSFVTPGWFGATDLLVNSWEGPGATGFAWQVIDASSSAIIDQGYYLYPVGSGIKGLNVSILHTGSSLGVQIDVSYHQAGVGHMVEVWDWPAPVSCGGPGGSPTLTTTRQLSCLTSYSRISMDTRHGYETAIVWEDPGKGINVVAGSLNSFGPAFTISGTMGHTIPDVAVTDGPGGQQIHVASYDPGAGIVEYSLLWNNIAPMGVYALTCSPKPCLTCAVPATFEDTNPVAAAPNSLHIDAPDNNVTNANWAYTYQIGNDVYARVRNMNPGSFPTPSYAGNAATVCFTDGSYSSLPVINSAINDVPVISYDRNNGSGLLGIYLAWHTAYIDPMYNPGSNAYIGIQINEDGTLQYPGSPYSFFGASMLPSNVSPTPTIALSKSSSDYSNILYTAFSESNAGSFWMQHRWIPWNAGQFKTAHTGGSAASMPAVSLSPNPFKDDMRVDFPNELEHESVMLKITDITGKAYGSFNSDTRDANSVLSNAARSLKPGNYFVTVECKKVNFSKVFKVVKIN